jgi:choline dehydrogenase-like flavoprotein
LSGLTGLEGVGLLPKENSPDTNWPELGFVFFSFTPSTDGGIARRVLGISDEVRTFLLLDDILVTRPRTYRLHYRHGCLVFYLLQAYGPYRNIQFGDGFTIVPYVPRPTSRGKVTLRSSDPFDPPKIFSNALKERSDVELLGEGN